MFNGEAAKVPPRKSERNSGPKRSATIAESASFALIKPKKSSNDYLNSNFILFLF